MFQMSSLTTNTGIQVSARRRLVRVVKSVFTAQIQGSLERHSDDQLTCNNLKNVAVIFKFELRLVAPQDSTDHVVAYPIARSLYGR